MPPGMRAKGAMCRIGSARSAELWFVEGIRHRSERRCRVEAFAASAAVVVCFYRQPIYVAGNSPPTLRVRGQRRQPDGRTSAWKTGLPYAMAMTTGRTRTICTMAAGVMAVAKK